MVIVLFRQAFQNSILAPFTHVFVSSSYTLVYASTVSIAYYTLVLYYAGMHEGQHVDDDQDEFQDRFKY